MTGSVHVSHGLLLLFIVEYVVSMTGYVHASHGLLLSWKKTKDVQYKLIFLFWQNVVSKNEVKKFTVDILHIYSLFKYLLQFHGCQCCTFYFIIDMRLSCK